MSAVLPRATRLGIGVPSIITTVLGVVLAGLQLANQLVLTSPAERPWRDGAAVAIAFLAANGITPLFGPALTNVLHIPARVLLAVSTGITVLTGVLTIVAIPVAAHAILATGLTFVGALLFGAPIPVAPVAVVPPVAPQGTPRLP